MAMRGDLTQRIKEKAAQLGFCGVGIAAAAPLSSEGAKLHEWLDRGFHGTMAWMERTKEKRRDPHLVLPKAQAVISVAYNYYADVRHLVDKSRGKISRYAWGDDYHTIVDDKLDQLQQFIQDAAPGAVCKKYVDTGPVMDKAWAVRAGLGWLGKHTNVITREYGSWVFLGEIITDIDLTPDDPIGDFCGSCTACIDACPTDAIVGPYVLDARRCISYLTIEHKGEIPPEYHARLENWVFGCDVCQDVCPWNNFQKETQEERFRPRGDNASPSLSELVDLSQEDFAKRFNRSPVKRAKRAGLRRNVLAVLQGHRDLSRPMS
jgi:epoxyqueuosine reductase